MRAIPAAIAALALLAGALVAGCGGDDSDSRSFTVTQTVPGVGSGGLSGSGTGQPAP